MLQAYKEKGINYVGRYSTYFLRTTRPLLCRMPKRPGIRNRRKTISKNSWEQGRKNFSVPFDLPPLSPPPFYLLLFSSLPAFSRTKEGRGRFLQRPPAFLFTAMRAAFQTFCEMPGERGRRGGGGFLTKLASRRGEGRWKEEEEY